MFSNRILDEVFKNKSLLSWDELDDAISRHNLDKVLITEPLDVRHSSASDTLKTHVMLITGTCPRYMAVGQKHFEKLSYVFLG